MKTITLKGVPDALYERLRVSAAKNHRSLNKEAMHCIEVALHPTRNVEEELARIDALRNELGPRWIIDDEFLNEAKNTGRE